LATSLAEMIERYSEVRAIDRHACRRIAETRFSADTMVESYCRVYEDLVAGHYERQEDSDAVVLLSGAPSPTLRVNSSG
jgi:hypothetical protein